MVYWREESERGRKRDRERERENERDICDTFAVPKKLRVVYVYSLPCNKMASNGESFNTLNDSPLDKLDEIYCSYLCRDGYV